MNEILKGIIEEYVNDEVKIDINLSLGNCLEKFKKGFNKEIRTKLKNDTAVYLFRTDNDKLHDILYIGMAGKIDRKGSLKAHRVRNRLKASRGRNSHGNEIQTNEFFYHLLTDPNQLNMKKYTHVTKPFQKIVIHVMYCKEGVPASYLESILLYEYFNENKALPLLNVSF
ncbi:MAG: hypothetical protein ACPGVD_06900 [Flavobacteriales bacterium]